MSCACSIRRGMLRLFISPCQLKWSFREGDTRGSASETPQAFCKQQSSQAAAPSSAAALLGTEQGFTPFIASDQRGKQIIITL